MIHVLHIRFTLCTPLSLCIHEQTSSLEQLLATLQRVFSASPPVYARPPAQAATANSHNKPSYGYGQYTNNSTSAHVQPHAQAGGYLTRVQTQPPLPPKPGAPPRLKPKPGQQGPHGEVGNGDGSSMDTSMNGSRNALRGVNTFSMGSGVGQSWQQPAQAQVTPPHPTHPQQAQAQRQYTQARRQYTQASSDSMYSISARGDTYNAHAYSTSQLPMMHAHSERDLRPTIGSPQSHPPSGGTQPQSPMASGQFGVADSTHALQQPQGYQHHRQPQEYPSQQQQYHQHQPPPPQSGQNQNGTPSHTSAFDELMGLDLSLSAPSPLSGAVAGGEPSANGVVPLASTSQQLVAGSSLASGHPPAQPHSATATVANSTAAVSVAKMNTEAHLVNDSLLDMDITPNAGPQGPDQQRLRRMRATKKLESASGPSYLVPTLYLCPTIPEYDVPTGLDHVLIEHTVVWAALTLNAPVNCDLGHG
ncbi:hypothetical protein SARC_08986 [Sphaeroforma arctica JP610]|uniref:Uncharacterized protein n=1 Tax=Sphaeroforma arctica JP610 TaxID=667725 RepID=A0A0L0FP79_9EUKA|nr:hypothetical protein SARC_08986 [Sphaeroforma arctica JP610]KNC78587.1 hypothetical protein SARC_08986 [Sphaeroforma arctica JP610]|eukprot:XP_014152489.1 hypothetical protein SARC_08986 [Sphaeroforma arctica JP610]